MATVRHATLSTLGALGVACGDLSWVSRLRPDPQTAQFEPNRNSREVKAGHYVTVRPTPLPDPTLVLHSSDLLTTLGLTPAAASAPDFVEFLSGAVPEPEPASGGGWGTTWATPYALAIYGQEMTSNCPFKNGNGYGDGRAISVGEVVSPTTGQRWELQLKGAGRTPFCRGGDGRAVLRSSLREFIASEAMHALGVPTTRALSLVVSGTETVARPWYSSESDKDILTLDDPRLAPYPPEVRALIIAQLQNEARDPNIMVREKCAITCRVAPSFLRVGHIDLFARRVRKQGAPAGSQARTELEDIVRHALFREYASSAAPDADAPLQPQILSMLRAASARIATLTAHWIRVGYCQGNFNSDNCLISGTTMDYGPFGFIERFQAAWNMWVGGGEHFSFLNQHKAGCKNFETLADACAVLLDESGRAEVRQLVRRNEEQADAALTDVWAHKLGMPGADGAQVASLMDELLYLLERSQADYTIFWRQLAQVAADAATIATPTDAQLLGPLAEAFYAPLAGGLDATFAKWLRRWRKLACPADGGDAAAAVAAGMRGVSPKYVPREWMLVEAYRAAQRGDYGPARTLQALFAAPYDEQPAMEAAFYRRAPSETYKNGGKGGVTHMS